MDTKSYYVPLVPADIKEATNLLPQCQRKEVKDVPTDSVEITWSLNGKDVADGYFSKNVNIVYLFKPDQRYTTITGEDAKKLRDMGIS